MPGESHMIKTMVCGYTRKFGVLLLEKSYLREVENYRDPFAVGRPKKDTVGTFDGLFFVDQNSQTSVLITRF